MLVAADIFRSLWLLIFPIITFVEGIISSNTGFCQVSGYFTQMGFEMSDYATLLIALHTSLQVFHPKPIILGQGGLHRHRYYVYVSFIVVPALLASLAFIKSGFAYLSQGPICSLPIRPFWYRLTTSWIPRYIIILVIISLYLAIYIHAEHQFSDSRLFRGKLAKAMRRLSDSRKKSRAQPQLRAAEMEKSDTANPRDPNINVPAAIKGNSLSNSLSMHQSQQHSTSSISPTDPSSTRNASSATGRTAQHLLSVSGRRSELPVENITSSPGPLYTRSDSEPFRSRLTSQADAMSLTASGLDTRVEIEEMHRKRNAIRKQLRLLFVYPVCYFIVWIGPFVNHVTLYNADRAAHPIFGLAVWTYISYAILGILNAVVFSLREKPWRHIPGSDGTILGSFQFWRQDLTIPRPSRSELSATNTTIASRRRSSMQVSPSRRLPPTVNEEIEEPLEQVLTSATSATHSPIGRAGSQAHPSLEGMATWDFTNAANQASQN